MDKTQRLRHCWECLKRRLVCDFAYPECKRCSISGVVCPGYNDTKPVKWLTTGKVISGNRNSGKAFLNRNEKCNIETVPTIISELFCTIDTPCYEITKFDAMAQAAEYCK
jgi:hypothetical protein